MNQSAKPTDEQDPYGQYAQTLMPNPGYAQYDTTAWSGSATQDQAALYAQSFSNYSQNQASSNAPAGAGWNPYPSEASSQPFNYYPRQNEYGFTNAPTQEISSANTIQNPYFQSSGYSNTSQQQNVIAPRQLQHVSTNGPFTLDEPVGAARRSSIVDGPSNKLEPSNRTGNIAAAYSTSAHPSSDASDAVSIVESLPKHQTAGGLFSVREFSSLAANQTFSAIQSAPFATLSSSSIDIDAKKGTIPAYKKRESSGGLKKYWQQQNSGQAKDETSSGPPLKKPKLATEKLSRSRKEATTAIKEGPLTASPQGKSPESSAESSEDDESNVESPRDEMTVADYLPPERPDDPAGAIKYDTIRALWLTTLRVPSAEEISASLKSFWDVMSGLRDQVSTLQSEIKDLELKGLAAELKVKKSKLDQARSLVDIAVETALKRGHSENLEHLGEVHLLMLFLREALVARSAEKSFSSRSVKAILELMSKFKTVTEELSSKLKLAKVFDRYKKAGDEEVKGLLGLISSNAVNATKKQKEKEKASTDKVNDGDSPKLLSKAPATSTTSKRPREEESKDSANKRPTPAAGISLSSQPSKNGGIVPDAKSGVLSKSKPAPPVKPTSFFKDLQSASKIAAKVTPQASMLKRPQAKPAVPSATPVEQRAIPKAPVAAPARAVFSFSETMANLNKPKEQVASPAPVPVGPPETEEEKQKRLRKEERRKLRVRFRDEASLVQVRLYVPENEEKPNEGDDSIKDVRDQSQEGQALKRHLNAEDEEDESEALRAYEALQELDFSNLADSRRKKNTITRGGEVPIHSEELHIQQQKEAQTLMVVYVSPNIPPSPREPAHSDTSFDQNSTIKFGEPNTATRNRESAIEAGGADQTLDSVLSSLQPRKHQPELQQPQQTERLEQSAWWFEQKHNDNSGIIASFEDYLKAHPREEYVKTHPRPWLLVHTPPQSPSLRPSPDKANGTAMDVDYPSHTKPHGFNTPSLPFNLTPIGEVPRNEYQFVLDTMKIDKIIRDVQTKPGANEIETAQVISAAIQVFSINPISKAALEMYFYNNMQSAQAMPDTNGSTDNQFTRALSEYNDLNTQSSQATLPAAEHNGNQGTQAAFDTYNSGRNFDTQEPPTRSRYRHESEQHNNDDHDFESSNRRRDDWRHDTSEASRRSREAHNESKKFTAPCKYFKQGRCLKGSKCTYLH